MILSVPVIINLQYYFLREIDLTPAHGVTLSRSLSLWEPLFSHQKTGCDYPGPTYQLCGRTVGDFEYEQAL